MESHKHPSFVCSLESGKNAGRRSDCDWRSASTGAADPVAYFSSEIVFQIFRLVPEYDLLHHCQLVCKRWRSVVSDPYLWQSKIALSSGSTSSRLFEMGTELKLDWAKFYLKVINQNLLNCFDKKGILSLSPWHVINSGGDGWCVKHNEIKNDKVQLIAENGGSKSCYVTSYHNCTRRQIVDLVVAGLHPEILDKLQPTIEASEWYAARWDCGSTYWIRVALLDASKEKKIVEDTFEDTTPQWIGGDKGWCKYSHSFNNYGPGVRYVEFWDQGKDTQFWAGHYGSKMAGAVIKVSFN